MIVGGRRQNQVRFRKLANGKIVKTLDEQYLRNDLPSGLANCPITESNPSCRLQLKLIGQDQKMRSSNVVSASSHTQGDAEENQNEVGTSPTIDKIFIVDHHFALNQIDMIENCDVLSNVVVLDSVLKHMNKVNIQGFHGLRNVLEQEDRRFYYFYNENCADTHQPESELEGLGIDAKLTNKVFSVFTWYIKLLQGLTSTNKVYLLTSNSVTK
jgi:hypothetical protein